MLDIFPFGAIARAILSVAKEHRSVIGFKNDHKPSFFLAGGNKNYLSPFYKHKPASGSVGNSQDDRSLRRYSHAVLEMSGQFAVGGLYSPAV